MIDLSHTKDEPFETVKCIGFSNLHIEEECVVGMTFGWIMEDVAPLSHKLLTMVDSSNMEIFAQFPGLSRICPVISYLEESPFGLSVGLANEGVGWQ